MKLPKFIFNLPDDEKLIITTSSGRPKAVIMSYSAYQKLQQPDVLPNVADLLLPTSPGDDSLTSDKVLARINSEIAQWKYSCDNPIELEDNLLANEYLNPENDESGAFAEQSLMENEDHNFYLETIDEDE